MLRCKVTILYYFDVCNFHCWNNEKTHLLNPEYYSHLWHELMGLLCRANASPFPKWDFDARDLLNLRKQQLCHGYSKQTLMQMLCHSHMVLSIRWNENTYISFYCGRKTADMCLFRACWCTQGPTDSPHCMLMETWEDKTRKPWTSSSFFSSAETGL